MLMAGYETTANTLVFLTQSVAHEPEVQEKLYKEIVEANKKFVSMYFFLTHDEYKAHYEHRTIFLNIK